MSSFTAGVIVGILVMIVADFVIEKTLGGEDDDG